MGWVHARVREWATGYNKFCLYIYISVTYDKIKKLFLFIRAKAHHTNNDKIYLKVKNWSTFIGFSKDLNEGIEITTDWVYSYQHINVIYHQQLLINIDGESSEIYKCQLII